MRSVAELQAAMKVVSEGPNDREVAASSRYRLTNVSEDIRAIFCRPCEDSGVRWSRMTWNMISIARAEDVAKLGLVVGPKS